MPIDHLSIKQLFEVIAMLRETLPEAEDKIQKYLDVPIFSTGAILERTTSEKSYAIYHASTQFNNKLHYAGLHNLWTARTRTIMGNTEKGEITALGYVERPTKWTYYMLEQACRHHQGLVPGHLKLIGHQNDMQDFLESLKK